jgi:hypothetical protein
VQEFVRACSRMRVDDHELAFLKLISLFATG